MLLHDSFVPLSCFSCLTVIPPGSAHCTAGTAALCAILLGYVIIVCLSIRDLFLSLEQSSSTADFTTFKGIDFEYDLFVPSVDLLVRECDVTLEPQLWLPSCPHFDYLCLL